MILLFLVLFHTIGCQLNTRDAFEEWNFKICDNLDKKDLCSSYFDLPDSYIMDFKIDYLYHTLQEQISTNIPLRKNDAKIKNIRVGEEPTLFGTSVVISDNNVKKYKSLLLSPLNGLAFTENKAGPQKIKHFKFFRNWNVTIVVKYNYETNMTDYFLGNLLQTGATYTLDLRETG